MRMKRIVAVFLVGVVLLLSACARPEPITPTTDNTPQATPPAPVVPLPVTVSTPTPTPEPSAVPGIYEVRIPGWEFKPASITVPVGATVFWINDDIIAHSVKSNDGLFNGSLMPRDSFSYTFTRSGTFSYYCEDHEGNATESGTVIVK